MIKKEREKGFTLLELLVVIGIIGLLASIIVVNLTSARKRARDTKRIADVRQVQTALEDYYGKTAQYPSVIYDLVTGGMLPIAPKDPLAPALQQCNSVTPPGNDDCYWYATATLSGTRQFYHLGAALEDTNSLLLNQDRDCDSTTGTNCPISTGWSAGFNGGNPTSGDTVGCDGSNTNKRCYDLAQ